MGSTLVVGKAPYSELNLVESNDPDAIKAQIRRQYEVDCEIEQRYRNQQFPDLKDVWRGDIIRGCWKGDFPTAKEALDLYLKLWNV